MEISRPIISLLTDFGLEDTYVGQVKAAMLSICPGANIVDLSHGVRPGNVRQAAFLLATSISPFPEGTVHVAVVDPGVGSERRAVCVLAGKAKFVAPDNGLLSLVLDEHPPDAVYEVTAREYFRDEVSHTFHGRDIFGPVGAHLACGLTPDLLGPRIQDIVRLDLPKASVGSNRTIEGEVIYIDHFGNAVTNIHRRDLRKVPTSSELCVECGRVRIPGVSKAYADCPIGEPLAIIGSFDRLEISVSGGSAEDTLGISEGDRVRVQACP